MRSALIVGLAMLFPAGMLSGILAEKAVAPQPAVRVFAPSFIYDDLGEAKEVSRLYTCTDIIGVPDGYRLEVLPNRDC